MSGAPARIHTFGPEPTRPVKKKGGTAEAGRPIGDQMLQIIEPDRLVKPGRRLAPDDMRKIEEERLEKFVSDRVAQCQKDAVLEEVTLSPALAAVLMRRNEGNRPVSEVNLDRLKRDLLGNRWEFNGEPVIISKTGQMNDGQHRCRAVIETGVSIRMVIVFGPTRDSRMTLDQGVARTAAHYLKMHGFTDANALSSVANYLWQYKRSNRLSTSGAERPTKTEARHTAEDHAGLPSSLDFVTRPGVGAVCTRQMLAFCHFIVAEKAGQTPANVFFDKLIKGTGLSDGDPILYCRKRLIETKSRANIQERADLILKTWNAHRLGEKVDRIHASGKKLPKIEA